MTFQLAPTAVNAGYRLEAHARVGSTNAIALERARAGDTGMLWVVSKNQESGRGRRGRVWETPEGNLAATLLIVLDQRLEHAATLGFVAGLALSDALAAIGSSKIASAADAGGQGRERFLLKWPNDVLADGAKLAGILLESTLLAGDRLAVAIGIGVNVVAHPQETPYPATSLSTLGWKGDAEQLFLALSDTWPGLMHIWDEGRGLGEIRDRWLRRAAGLGSEVAVRVDGAVSRGIFETIDDDCRFLVREADGGLITISAGDVHFGAVASASAQ